MADSMATVMKLLRLVNDKEKNHTLVMSDIAAKMKNKEYHTVGRVPKSNRQIIEVTLIPIMHIYMTVHFPGLVHTLQ